MKRPVKGIQGAVSGVQINLSVIALRARFSDCVNHYRSLGAVGTEVRGLHFHLGDHVAVDGCGSAAIATVVKNVRAVHRQIGTATIRLAASDKILTDCST